MSDQPANEPIEKGAEATASTSEPAAPEALQPADATTLTEVPAAEPEPVCAKRCRQWVTLRGSSMDARVGCGISAEVAHDLRSVVGRPHACALLHAPDVDEGALAQMERGLSDQGFEVLKAPLPQGEGCCDLAHASELSERLCHMHVTSDDLVVALGHAPELSLASLVCQHWCGGTPVALVPLDLASAVTAGVTPMGLAVDGVPNMLQLDGSARFEICDLDLFGLDDETPEAAENVLYAFALMVASAMADCTKAFETLWDATDALVSGDRNALTEQLVATLRSRGKVVSSSSVAVRQSIEYGQTFAHALEGLVGDAAPRSAMLADALRFASRVAVASGELSIDDMLTQDELLENLGLGTVECAVDADALYEALRAERFRRTNRFMLEVPRAIGRVRLANVEEDLLREHVAAWCGSRPQAQ